MKKWLRLALYFIVMIGFIGVLIIVQQTSQKPYGDGYFKVYGPTGGESVMINYWSDVTAGQIVSEQVQLPWTKPLYIRNNGPEVAVQIVSLNGVPITCEIWIGDRKMVSVTDNLHPDCYYDAYNNKKRR